MRVLIDGDIIVYSCGFAGEHKTYTIHRPTIDSIICTSKKELKDACALHGIDPDTISPILEVEPLENILHSVKLLIQSIVEETGATKYQIYLSGEDNYRDTLATIKPYKGNRDSAHKPKYYNEIKEYLIRYHNAIIVEGREADDAMGCEQYIDTSNTCIASLDKDLNMIPGWHYNWRRKEKYWVDDISANKFFYKQVLMGDVTDNIQGIPKIGPKKADTLVEACPHYLLHDMVIEQYEKYYGDTGYKMFKENANLLWIQRKEGKLYA